MPCITLASQLLTPSSGPALEPTDGQRPPMREPCGLKCRRRCSVKFSEDRRRDIWRSYWMLAYSEKRSFMFHHVSQVARVRVCRNPSRRSRSFIYRLRDEHEVPQQVCKLFFLSTLGYHPANDSIVQSVMGKEMTTVLLAPPMDMRGRHEPANKLDPRPIHAHIETFHTTATTASRHRRGRAPRRRHLPGQVTVKQMYLDYIEKGNTCCYETYRKAAKTKLLQHFYNV